MPSTSSAPAPTTGCGCSTASRSQARAPISTSGSSSRDPGLDLRALVDLDLAFAEVFEPLRVDLVPIQRVDPLFQARIIDGHRIFAGDSTQADLYELLVFRRAAEQLPSQRAREIELFGVSTTTLTPRSRRRSCS
ncbi:MAG TPA: hypothetical protein VHB47_23350 [Thermoanaerobaculia bacterium]|nr:hypothetical protein [Thermoanaerobaculia bacterium]